MKKNLYLILFLAANTLSSCIVKTGQADKEPARVETATPARENIIRKKFSNPAGDTLVIIFNTTIDEATVVFSGETVKLKGQRPASGIWYKNYNYELRGKGEQVELKRDGQMIFKN